MPDKGDASMLPPAPVLLFASVVLVSLPAFANAQEPAALYRLHARGAGGLLGGEQKFTYTLAAERAGNEFRLVYREVDARGDGIRPGDVFFVGALTGDVAEGRVTYRIPHHGTLSGLFAGARCPDLSAPGTVRLREGGRILHVAFAAPERDGMTCRPTGKTLHNAVDLPQINPPPLAPPKIAEAPKPPVTVHVKPLEPPPKKAPPPPSNESPVMILWVILAFAAGAAGATLWFVVSTRPPPLPDPPLHSHPSGGQRSPRLSDFLPQYPGSPLDAIRSPTENLRARRNFTEESTGLLRAKADETKALGEVMHARSQVALQLGEYAAIAPLLKHGDPNADVSSVTLTLPEIAETLRIGLPALPDELRAEVIRLLRQAMEAKLT